MSGVRVSTDGWPLVLVTLPAAQSDDEVLAYFDELRACRARREPYAIVVDAAASRGFSAKQRRMQAQYVSEGLELSGMYLKGLAFIAPSELIRGMLTAIFWLQRPASPHRVFTTKEEAVAWARERVEGRRA